MFDGLRAGLITESMYKVLSRGLSVVWLIHDDGALNHDGGAAPFPPRAHQPYGWLIIFNTRGKFLSVRKREPPEEIPLNRKEMLKVMQDPQLRGVATPHISLDALSAEPSRLKIHGILLLLCQGRVMVGLSLKVRHFSVVIGVSSSFRD